MSTIIIAECCQNHNGDQDLLKRMIHTAAENGSDYVKIQAIRSSELTYRERFEAGELDDEGNQKVIKRPYDAELKRLALLDLNKDQEHWFVEECKRAGTKALTTVFSRTGVQEVKDMGYAAMKVASYDCASYPLLADIKKYWNKVFISTGSTFDEEIKKAAEVLEGVDFEFLHCVTIYPTPLEELHLSRIEYLQQFTPKVGYSDHSKPATTGLWACKIAIALGASCIERHYTVLKPEETRDGPVSITPAMVEELREFDALSNDEQWDIINKQLPDWKKCLGDANRPMSATELLNRDYYRGRFASKVDGKTIYNWEEVPMEI